MGRSLIQLYALTVCFAALMCFVVALGLGLYDLVRITWPGFTVQEYLLWRSDEHYLMYYPDKRSLPAAEVALLREEAREQALAAERRSALQRLVLLAIIVGIDVVVYGIHWRIARRAVRLAVMPGALQEGYG
jgi:hypothetical protein